MQRISLIKVALAATMALFAIAALYISSLIAERQHALSQVSRYNIAWSISQAVAELGRFEHRVAAFGLPSGAATRDEVELRFQILMNRLQLLNDGEVQAFANADTDRRAIVTEFAAAVHAVQALLPGLENPGTIEEILGYLVPLEGRLVQLASAANRYGGEQVNEDQRQLLRLHTLFSILSLGLTGGGLVLATLLFWHNRLLIRAHSQLSALADNLRSTTVSKEYLDEIVGSMSEGLLVLTEAGVIEKVNSTACRLTGYREDELVGAPLDTLVHPAPRDPKNQNKISAEKMKAVAAISTRDGGTVPVRLSSAIMPTPTESGDRLVCVFQDLRQEQRAEAERGQLREQLYQARKMKAIGTLAGGIAHDFNNILGSVIGYCALSLEEVSERHPLFANLQQIMKAGSRGKSLVQQVLAYSRNAEFVLLPMDASEVIAESIDTIRPTLSPDIEVRADCPEAVRISADRTQIHQVLLNLCVNAGQAIGDRPGTIEVAVDQVYADEVVVHDPSEAGDEDSTKPTRLWFGTLDRVRYCRVVVSDTGCGMDRRTMTRIFDPFFTTKEVGKGTGLGLAAVHGILRNHNGVIAVESALGKGSRFEVYLPTTEDGVESEVAADAAPAPIRGHERIMLVDDDPSLLEVTRKTLAKLGYKVDAFTRPMVAAFEFQKQPDAWDLVVTDRMMPKLDGLLLAEEMLAVRPELPIIMVTGYGEELDEAKAKAIGIREFLFKPVLGRALADIVRQVLDQVAETRKAA
jgi:PAS domain S-box-containing protein